MVFFLIMKFKFIFRTVSTSLLRFFRIKNIINIFFAFIIKFISLKIILRIIFLYVTGLLFRLILIKYCNVDVFHDCLNLYSNLYYLFMATLSMISFENFHLVPNWSDIFERVKIFIEYCQKDKMVVGPPSSGYYGDVSSIGRKTVCSMDSASSSNTNNSNSDSGINQYSTDQSDPNLSRTENLNNKIRDFDNRIRELQGRVIRLDILTRHLNDPEIRAIADKMDRNILLNSDERWKWYSTLNSRIRFATRFREACLNESHNNALNDEVHRNMSSMSRCHNKIYVYYHRMQNCITEKLDIEDSQNQSSTSDSSSDNDNN